ncbi:MAG: quinone oxidoreductase [Planktomarina sp.]|jgi:NADPH2:quinone reductase|nr:quinone oxidoreductase [Planktomarina sp.]MDT2072614.1 quinone oxidoreductase [Planktomarina sp.]HAJ83595.1 quinone oxidoreductase [Paracoccaceae bacterium]|tara:strand:+ start:22082 stop:23056 length:975 start_codon:yes stop_codon:yes gene_type:complete
MTKTVVIKEFGGSDQLEIMDIPVGDPARGQVRIAHKACGLNFIDVYQRTGLYPLNLPQALGMEGAGVIEAVGEGVTHLKVGDRAAYASMPPGSYCERRVMPAAQVCLLPDGISFEQGAAMMLQGMTVQYLFHRTTPLQAGDTVLFHAAAGGVGLIACQWAKSEGITLIGTAGTDEKCKLALDYGATHCINYNIENFEVKVKELTGGKGVDVVMDSVGASTFEGSLNSLKPLGMLITFGNASGPVPPFNLAQLGAKGSLKITRPTLFTHIGNHEHCQEMARHLFSKVTSGEVEIVIGQEFSLADVRLAHDALEGRATTGSTILIV